MRFLVFCLEILNFAQSLEKYVEEDNSFVGYFPVCGG